MKLKPCQHCNGTGREIDQFALGIELKQRRILAKLSLREVAKAMGFSAMYLCDLEHGRRDWSTDKIEAYNETLNRRPTKPKKGKLK